MKLRKPCEHGAYDSHWSMGVEAGCPGGEFLADDALTKLFSGVVWKWSPGIDERTVSGFVDELLVALTVREGAG